MEELTAAVHAQAKQLERTAERIEQSTGPLGLASEFAVVAAESAALLVRLKKLASGARAPEWHAFLESQRTG